MTQATIHDALAVKLGSLADVKVVYGDGSTNPAVKPWPGAVVAMPSVLVKRGTDERDAALSREHWATRWNATFYLSLVKDAAAATRKVNTLADQLRVEFRSGFTLGGLVSFVDYLGSDEPIYRQEGEGEAVIQYLVWTTHFETHERIGVAYTT